MCSTAQCKCSIPSRYFYQVGSIKRMSGGKSSGAVDISPRMVYLNMKDDSQQVRCLLPSDVIEPIQQAGSAPRHLHAQCIRVCGNRTHLPLLPADAELLELVCRYKPLPAMPC